MNCSLVQREERSDVCKTLQAAISNHLLKQHLDFQLFPGIKRNTLLLPPFQLYWLAGCTQMPPGTGERDSHCPQPGAELGPASHAQPHHPSHPLEQLIAFLGLSEGLTTAYQVDYIQCCKMP